MDFEKWVIKFFCLNQTTSFNFPTKKQKRQRIWKYVLTYIRWNIVSCKIFHKYFDNYPSKKKKKMTMNIEICYIKSNNLFYDEHN